MTYLQRINYQPNMDSLSEKEVNYVRQHFDAYGKEALVNGQPVRWEDINEVEVAVAARARGAAGWIVKNLIVGGDRYHVAFYAGYSEFVLPNLTWNVARYIVLNAAYYAPGPVEYKGPEDLVPLTEI